MTISKKPYPIGSPEAKAVIQKIREQELARAGMTEDAYGHSCFRGKTPITPEVRAKVLRMIQDGIPKKHVARTIGISYSSVNRIEMGVR